MSVGIHRGKSNNPTEVVVLLFSLLFHGLGQTFLKPLEFMLAILLSSVFRATAVDYAYLEDLDICKVSV